MSSRRTEIEHLSGDVKAARAAVARRRQLDEALARARTDLAAVAARVAHLESIHRREAGDVEKLDAGAGLSPLYRVLGTMATRRDRKLQECVAAERKLEAARKKMSVRQQKMAALEVEISRLAGAETRLETALALKAAWIRAHNEPLARELDAVEKGLVAAHDRKRALEAVVQLAESADLQLNDVGYEVAAAENSLFMFEHLRKGRRMVLRVQVALDQFQRACSDADLPISPPDLQVLDGDAFYRMVNELLEVPEEGFDEETGGYDGIRKAIRSMRGSLTAVADQAKAMAGPVDREVIDLQRHLRRML